MRIARIIRLFVGLLILLLGTGFVSGGLPESAQVGQPAAGCPTQTTVVPLPVTVQVSLQRPNAPPPHASWSVPVHLSLYPPGETATVCHEWDLMLDESGQYVPLGIGDYLTVFSGTYDVRVRNLHTLRNVKRSVEFYAPLTINMGTLLEGDASGDNRVRSSDFAILSAAYFTREGDTNFDPRADFDEDNRIRSSDFALLSVNYFLSGDLEVGSAQAVAGPINLQGEVDVGLEPAFTTAEVGETITLTLTAHAGVQPFISMDAEIFFSPDLFEVVDASGSPASSIEPVGPLLGLYNVVDNSAGRILYLAGALPAKEVSGDVQLARIRLRAKANTPGAVIDLADAVVSAISGVDVQGEFTDALVRVGHGAVVTTYLPVLVRQ